jgi:hypothetical protein
MTDTRHTSAFTVGTEEGFLWLKYRASAQSWLVEVHARCPDGIMYLQKEYLGETIPAAELALADALQHGIFSPRPCRLDGYIDPSMAHCVIALLCRFCRDRKIDVRELFDQAAHADRPVPSKTDLAFFVLQGVWEGIVVPTEWSSTTTENLLHALTEVGWEDLADSLEQKLSSQR